MKKIKVTFKWSDGDIEVHEFNEKLLPFLVHVVFDILQKKGAFQSVIIEKSE